MSKILKLAPALAGVVCLAVIHSARAEVVEKFGSDPLGRGWEIFGNTNQFHWNEQSQSLEVTWDSALPNAYFYRPLGTVLSKADDFAVEFDLKLVDIATAAKSGPFQVALGLIDLAQATRPGFQRGTGVNPDHGPRSTLEFDYFPAGEYPGWGTVDPSVMAVMTSSENEFGYATKLAELATNEWYHVALSYSANDQVLRTVITLNGSPFGTIPDLHLDANPNFVDFRFDTMAVLCYTDAGDDYDSVLAHGVVDNIVVATPPLPVERIVLSPKPGAVEVFFASRVSWVYTLERTTDLLTWETVAGSSQTGTGGELTLKDTAQPAGGRSFYRVRATK
jgi:hypothetical protein